MTQLSYSYQRQLAIGAGFLFILFITVLIYWPGLSGPMLLDDFVNLSPLKQLDADPTLLTEVVTSNTSGLLGRPVTMFSFAINQLASGWDKSSFKYSNLMVHVLCGALIFWLTGRLLKQSHPEQHWEAALWVTALWVLSPMFVSTVLYVVQRMAQLAALFTLAGLLSYVIGRQDLHSKKAIPIALIVSTFLLWTPLAAFSKENGGMLPMLVLLTEILWFRFQGERFAKVLLTCLFVIFVLLPVVMSFALFIMAPEWIIGGYELRPFTISQRMMTEARILWTYFFNLIAPQSASFGIYHDDYPISIGLFQPLSTFISISALGIVSLLLLSIWNRRYIPLQFGIAFFLIGHLLESTILPLELYFEHRNYLPGVGIFLSLAALAFSVLNRFQKLRSVFIFALFLVPSIYAVATVNQVKVWGSTETLLSYAGTFHPTSVRSHTDIALFYAHQGEIDRALSHTNVIKQIDPKRASSLVLLRLILHCSARTQPSLDAYVDLQKYSGTYSHYLVENLKALTDKVLDGECGSIDLSPLVSALDETLDRVPPSDWRVPALAAKLHAYAGDYSKALAYAKRAHFLDSDQLTPLMMAVYYQIRAGDISQARLWLDKLQMENAKHGQIRSVKKIIGHYSQMIHNVRHDANPNY